MSYSSEVLADTPLAYWRLGEASGVPQDSSGNGRNAAQVTGTPGRVAGLLVGDADGCFNFAGTVWVDTPAIPNPTTMSVEALISLTNRDKYQHVHARADESGFHNEIFKLVVSATNKAEMWVKVGGAWATATGTTVLSTATTYHLAGTFDGSNVRIYVNGVAEATTAASGAFSSTPGGLIGAGYNGGIYAKFDGKIDEVAYYGSALSSTRIAVHVAAATGLAASPADSIGVADAVSVAGDRSAAITEPIGVTDAVVIAGARSAVVVDAVGVSDLAGLAAHGYQVEVLADAPAAYWRMGEAAGTVLTDSSGNGRSGTWTGGPLFGALGLQTTDADTATTLGGSQYAIVPAGAWMTPAGGLTVEALVQTTSLGQIALPNRDWDGRHFQFFINGGKLSYVTISGSAGVRGLSSPVAGQLSDGRRHHVAVTHSSTTITLYIDGVAVASDPLGGTAPGSAGGVIAIGSDIQGGAGPRNFYVGDMDEAAYYTTALSAARIAAHVDAMGPTPAFPNDPVGITDSLLVERERGLPVNKVGITDALVVDFKTPETPVADAVSVVDAVSTAIHQLGSVYLPYVVNPSGSVVLDFATVPTSPEEPWPFPWEGDGYSNSLWAAFTATDTQTLSLSLATSFAAGIEVWAGTVVNDSENDLSILGYGQGTLEVAIAAGQRILMRAHPLSLTQTSGTGTLTWSVAARAETGVLGFVTQAELLETPGWLDISLLSASPDADVTLTLDGSVIFTVHTEEDGTFEGSIEVPLLVPGPHLVTATDVSGQTDTQTFTVLIEPQPPEPIPGSTGPTTGISTDPVIKWVLEDPAPGGLGNYTFPLNPSEMSSPWPVKALRADHTIHGSGQDIIWEGRADPVDWTVKGTVQTQAFYERLEAYRDLNRRLYVIDHHQRGWVVAFEGLTFEKKGSPGDLWFYSYTAKFLILGGPVSLS